MFEKVYVCNLWPELTLGSKIKFVGGIFRTEDKILQDKIEQNNAFGSSIHWQDPLAIMEARSHQEAEQRANEKARRINKLRMELKEALKQESEGVIDAQADAKLLADQARGEAEIEAAGKIADEEKVESLSWNIEGDQPIGDVAGIETFAGEETEVQPEGPIDEDAPIGDVPTILTREKKTGSKRKKK